jgi:hypothetical protein
VAEKGTEVSQLHSWKFGCHKGIRNDWFLLFFLLLPFQGSLALQTDTLWWFRVTESLRSLSTIHNGQFPNFCHVIILVLFLPQYCYLSILFLLGVHIIFT